MNKSPLFRETILLSILLINTLFALGQRTVIKVGSSNTVYVNFSNHIIISNPKFSCKDLYLTTNNGKINPRGAGTCEFNWSPDSIGIGRINVYGVSGKDTINLGSEGFLLKYFVPVLQLWHSKNGIISLDSLKKSNGPYLFRENFGYSIYGVEPKLISYSILALRNSEVVFNIRNLDGPFTLETKRTFNLLEKSDILLIYDISYDDLFAHKTRITPVEIKIE